MTTTHNTDRDAPEAGRSLCGLAPSAIALTFLFALLASLLLAAAPLSDFGAGWMAGRALSEGRADLVYPAAPGLFTMEPPVGWIGWAEETGYDGNLYPFLYPPLWAWLSAAAGKVLTFYDAAHIAIVLNALMLCGMLLLAHRMARPAIGQTAYLAIGLGFLCMTVIAPIALWEGQAQIFVAFLTVLALALAAEGRERSAGAALALAAALKVVPAAFALFWLVSGQRRAAGSFALSGLALALLSVALAGWPLHRAFLDAMGDIGQTSLVTGANYGLKSLAAHLLFGESLIAISPTNVVDPPYASRHWFVLADPPLFHWAFVALQFATLIGLALLFRAGQRRGLPREAIWPFAMALFAFMLPLTWSHYYLAALAFLPALLARPLNRTMLLALVVLAATLSPFVRIFVLGDIERPLRLFVAQTLGTLVMAAIIVIFGLNLRQRWVAGR